MFGEGKFIGEGISEPIRRTPRRSSRSRLDCHIVVETNDGQKDDILRVLAVQRGVFSTESKHTRTTKLVFHNRLTHKANINIRHTVPKGYTLDEQGFVAVQKIGAAHVLGIQVEPGAKKEIVISETTPVFKTIDLRLPGGLDAAKAYVSSAATWLAC